MTVPNTNSPSSTATGVDRPARVPIESITHFTASGVASPIAVATRPSSSPTTSATRWGRMNVHRICSCGKRSGADMPISGTQLFRY